MIISNWPALNEVGIVRWLSVLTDDRVCQIRQPPNNKKSKLTGQVICSARAIILCALVVVLIFVRVIPFAAIRIDVRRRKLMRLEK